MLPITVNNYPSPQSISTITVKVRDKSFMVPEYKKVAIIENEYNSYTPASAQGLLMAFNDATRWGAASMQAARPRPIAPQLQRSDFVSTRCIGITIENKSDEEVCNVILFGHGSGENFGNSNAVEITCDTLSYADLLKRGLDIPIKVGMFRIISHQLHEIGEVRLVIQDRWGGERVQSFHIYPAPSAFCQYKIDNNHSFYIEPFTHFIIPYLPPKAQIKFGLFI